MKIIYVVMALSLLGLIHLQDSLVASDDDYKFDPEKDCTMVCKVNDENNFKFSFTRASGPIDEGKGCIPIVIEILSGSPPDGGCQPLYPAGLCEEEEDGEKFYLAKIYSFDEEVCWAFSIVPEEGAIYDKEYYGGIGYVVSADMDKALPAGWSQKKD